MGFATHLGPWLLGTVKNTTGTTAGTIRNMGATVVSQSANVVFGTLTGTAFVLPAGAQITDIKVVTTALFDAATTITLSIGGTAFTATSSTIAAVGSIPLEANGTTPGAWVNVGATDAIVNYTLVGTITSGAATVIVSYAVRNSDGAANPTSTQN
tara:strand:- start:2629 stop:3093 length:465 start_codon:yes stop_codon:yes gene_type:complete